MGVRPRVWRAGWAEVPRPWPTRHREEKARCKKGGREGAGCGTRACVPRLRLRGEARLPSPIFLPSSYPRVLASRLSRTATAIVPEFRVHQPRLDEKRRGRWRPVATGCPRRNNVPSRDSPSVEPGRACGSALRRGWRPSRAVQGMPLPGPGRDPAPKASEARGPARDARPQTMALLVTAATGPAQPAPGRVGRHWHRLPARKSTQQKPCRKPRAP